MNTTTQAIAVFETDLDAKMAGYDEPLTEEEAKVLGGMNRKARRAALAELRREGRRGR